MKKDIHLEEVKNISIAIVPENLASGEPEWVVYFLNLKDVPVSSVLINAEGRGMVAGEERHTATMRFFLDKVEPKSFKKFEMILPEAFALNNQYWVSFYIDQTIFDKKYLFAANTINQDRLVIVPLLNKPGVLVN
jgi:hypothetical protein